MYIRDIFESIGEDMNDSILAFLLLALPLGTSFELYFLKLEIPQEQYGINFIFSLLNGETAFRNVVIVSFLVLLSCIFLFWYLPKIARKKSTKSPYILIFVVLAILVYAWSMFPIVFSVLTLFIIGCLVAYYLIKHTLA